MDINSRRIRPVLIKGIEALGKEGQINTIANLLAVEGLGKGIKAQIEKSIIEGIKRIQDIFIYRNYVTVPDHSLGSEIENALLKKGVSDKIMSMGIKALRARRDYFLIADLLGKRDLSDDVKKQIWKSLIEGAEHFRKEGRMRCILLLLGKENLSDDAKKQIGKSLIEGIRDKFSKTSYSEEVYCLMDNFYAYIENYANVYSNIYDLIGSDELTDGILFEAIRLILENGRLFVGARLLGKEELSDKTKQKIEELLIEGIKECGKKGDMCSVRSLLFGEETLSDAVLIAGIETLAQSELHIEVIDSVIEAEGISDRVLMESIRILREKEYVYGIAKMLEKKDLSDSVKEQIEEALVEGILNCMQTGRMGEIAELTSKEGVIGDTVKSLVRRIAEERNPLARNGILSKGKVKGPAKRPKAVRGKRTIKTQS